MHELLKRFSGKRILVVGDAMLDRYLMGSVDRISPEAPVPVVLLKAVLDVPGGSGNVSRNLSALGASVMLAGVVGADPGGELLADLLRGEGVDTGGLIRAYDRPTTLKARVVSGHQQLLRIDEEKTGGLPDAETGQIIDFMERVSHRVDGVIISDYNKGVVGRELMSAVHRIFRGEIPVVVDPKPENIDLIENVDVIKPNLKEIEAVAGKKLGNLKNLELFCRKLMDRKDYRAVLVTRGNRGMILAERDGPCREIPAAQCEVYDVSGAGDTVCAVLTLGICAGMSFYDSARVANLAASLVVRKSGTSVVHPGELSDYLEKFYV